MMRGALHGSYTDGSIRTDSPREEAYDACTLPLPD